MANLRATPAAVIHRGTTPDQRSISGTLENIAQKVETARLTPPAIFVVGSVVELQSELNWFETRPLWGKRILVTRSRHQASAFVKLLTEYGATCLEAPTIEILPPDDSYAALDQALEGLDRYHWLVFTSPNGVAAFFNRLLAAVGMFGLWVNVNWRLSVRPQRKLFENMVWWPMWCRRTFEPRAWWPVSAHWCTPVISCCCPGPRKPGKFCPRK